MPTTKGSSLSLVLTTDALAHALCSFPASGLQANAFASFNLSFLIHKM